MRRFVLPSAAFVAAAVAPALGQINQSPSPPAFGDANSKALTQICHGGGPGLGPNLASICNGAAGRDLDVSGAGIITSIPPSTAQRERLKESEATEAAEKGSGGSADSQVYRLAGNVSLFVFAGGDSVTHRASVYEEPYHAADGFVTAGVSAHPVDWLTYGAGFTYRHLAGSFEDFGGFHIDSYRPFVFASVLPFDGAFIDAELGYARLNNTRNRGANVAAGGINLAHGIATGTPGENAYEAAILAGYDRQFGILTVGPRLGLTAGQYDIDGYTEAGSTGLELRYQSLNQSSVQSLVGMAAKLTIATDFGALQPGIAASWVHEFQAYQRQIHAAFVQAPGTPSFSFYSERPAADFGVLALHVAAVLPGRLLPFMDFTTVVGNGHYQSYGGALGLTYAW